ncbi:hypothetical protein CDV36_016379 [Fusarium kuroshium]|uniref:Metallo-beta-lactamase domain-containing protein n=1 Tax=Fusarium kuroshium TaxID=2010991 RepID=A0A3M2QSD8_9HYPO|nr:hypothetical protein CDV36_016379 [Fusarium kuroshium]
MSHKRSSWLEERRAIRFFRGEASIIITMLSSLFICAFGALFNGALGQDAQPPGDILAAGIEALGGMDNISRIETVSYVGPRIYRTRTVMESFSITGLDKFTSTTGQQNISFSYDGPYIKQRIDRFHQLDAAWGWARPLLEPFNFSLVIQGGSEGFAAVVAGSYNLLAPGAPPSGYRDGLQAAFHISEANKMSPLLLTAIRSSNYTQVEEEISTGERLPAVYDPALDLTVIFNPNTSLPYIIRSYEDHRLWGRSTHDLLVHDYAQTEGVMFPRRFKTFYNGNLPLGDYLVDEVLINQVADPAHFDGPEGLTELNTPAHDDSYGFAEIGEYTASYLWEGQYTGTFANISATTPYPDIPGAWVLTFQDAPTYRQMVLELDDSVIVFDAPAHQNLLVMQWVEETLGKSVTHVWPTHHHHDHALGVADYIANGAKLITVEEAREYYTTVPASQFLTYSTHAPLVLEGANVQATFIHMNGSLHAWDQSYAHITPSCTAANSTSLIFDADHATPFALDVGDHGSILELVDRMSDDRVATDTFVVSAHSDPVPLSLYVETIGYRYPTYSSLDYRFGVPACSENKVAS